jgi:hypothetical protein
MSIKIVIAEGFFNRLVLGSLQGFFKFARQDIFPVFFGFAGLAEFVFALAFLLGQNIRRVGKVHARRSFGRHFVREHHGELRIDRQLRPAARAIDFDGRWDCGLIRHAGILRHNGAAKVSSAG